MGAAASQEDDVIFQNGVKTTHPEKRVAPPYASSGGSSRAKNASTNRPASQISRQLSKSSFNRSDATQSSRPTLHRKNTVSRFIGDTNDEGYEEAEIFVSKSGFSMQNLHIMEGQTVKFRWDTDEKTVLNILQVVHDGEKLRPVIGGFGCSQSQSDELYEQKFNLEGDYKFAISGIRATPLTILVRPRVDLQAEVTDYGFSPKIINIDKGHTVKWSWVQCSVPHSIQEVNYDITKGGFTKRKTPYNTTLTSTVTGSFRYVFKRPGLYYFQTDGMDLGDSHLCIVHVRDTQRECKVEVLDRSFNQMIVLIEEGDRVWWHWDRFKCKKLHSVYQMKPPKMGHPSEEPYEPVEDGFRWTTPSKQGLLSYQFHIPGVYFFSDQNFDEAAEYVGTVIVKPKQKEHHIELSENGFVPDLWYAQTGDRIWWTWSGQHVDRLKQTLTIKEIDKALNPATKHESVDDTEPVQYISEESSKLCSRLGLATVQYTTVGVYHYRVAEASGTGSTCSLIVNPGAKNYTIHLTDNGFEPKVMTIRPNDRVWWVWQTGQKQHNVMQVSHQGSLIEGGFGSGAPRDCPSAYTYQFHEPGVFYFKCVNLSKMFGAVVVSTQPQVHEIQVLKSKLTPDPVVINVNDIVCWVFSGLRHHQLQQVTTVDQILDSNSSEVIAPRRCLAQAIKQEGVFHFCSKSFQKGKRDKEKNSDVRLSTVITDDRFDNSVVRVTKNGFRPPALYVSKGESVLWSWKLTEDPHNIIHVTAVDSQTPLNVVQGAKSFNSGKPVPSHSFLYTFDEPGSFTVASQGAPGYSCTVHVLKSSTRCHEPCIVKSPDGGTVERYTTILLSCDTPNSVIYYTTDGSKPDLQSENTLMYDDGVILNESGLQFIRALAVCQEKLNSHVMTSRRYWVLSDDTDEIKEAQISARHSNTMDFEKSQTTSDMTDALKWLSCNPTIKGCVTQPGELEIYWLPPPADCMDFILGYQLYLNGISYCEMFPPQQNTINVAGLAGGRRYEIQATVFPKSNKFSLQESNKLSLKCPLATHDHGPVISLETTHRPDSLAVVWMCIDTESDPIEGYLLFLNDVQMGKTLVPDKDSDRCKVLVEKRELNFPYKVVVFALPKARGKPKTSNLLEVKLPLKTEPIVLPPYHQRMDDQDVYQEFLEIREGSGYLLGMDQVDSTEDYSEGTQTIARRQPKVSVSGVTRALTGFRQLASLKIQQRNVLRPLSPIGTNSEVVVPAEKEFGVTAPTPGQQHVTSFQAHANQPKTFSTLETFVACPTKVTNRHISDLVSMTGNPIREAFTKRSWLHKSVSSPAINLNPLRLGRDKSHDLSPLPQKPLLARSSNIPLNLDEEDSCPVTSPATKIVADSEKESAETTYKFQFQKVKACVKFLEKRKTPEPVKIPPPLSTEPSPSPGNQTVSQRMVLDAIQIMKTTAPRRFSFKSIARKVLEFVSMERKLRQCVAPESFKKTNILSWGRLRSFFHAASVFRKSIEERRADDIPPEAVLYLQPPHHHHDSAKINDRKVLQTNHDLYTRVTGQPYYQKLFQGIIGVDESDSDSSIWSSDQSDNTDSEVEYLYRATGGREVTSDDMDKGTQTPWRGKAILDPEQARKARERSKGRDQSDSSDTETGSDEETEGNAVCMINMSHVPDANEQDIERQRSGVSKNTDGSVEIDVRGIDEPSIMAQAMVHRPDDQKRLEKSERPKKLRHKKRPKSAIIDVRDADEFNVDQAIYEDGRKRLRVVKTPALRRAPPGERLPRPDLEGQFIVCDGDDILPAPSVMVESRGRDGVKVEWELPRQPDPEYRLLIYVVNVIGEGFDSNINSDISFECSIDEDGKPVGAVQHCWNISGKHSCHVRGLLPNKRYRLYVVANYTQLHGPKPVEMQTTSSVLYYTTLGAPKPPTIKVISVDLYQACLEWQLEEVHEDYRIKGYRIFINKKPHPDLQPRRIHQVLINHMVPGDTLEIAVMAISKHEGYNSDLSRRVKVTCPKRPPPPVINQQPSYKKGCVLIAWDRPAKHRQTAREDDISLYCVYTEDKWYGEIRANASGDKQGYQFFLTDLTPAQSYDVCVKTICGPRRVDSKADHVFCLSDSPYSNVQPIMAPAAPHSPKLRIEGLHPEGIDVTWQVPQQYGDAGISGYQMLKNGKLYGSLIPPDVNSLRIKDLTLGEKVTLQVIALTDHPVGRLDLPLTDKDSGIDGSSHPEERDLTGGEKYAGCKPGAPLVLHYSGLVVPPSRVWAEEVTGHSALIVWKIDDHPKSHFVRPESYQVTWWPGDRPEGDINSDSTTDDHILISNLIPSSTYTVIVEARKMQQYSDVDEDGRMTDEDGMSAFILTSKSEQMTLKTASPPEPATHLGVIATTCNSIKLAWNPPKEHGVEVIGMRVDCTPAKDHNSDDHVCVDLMPDATYTVLENLTENTDYRISVTAVTQEFFDTLPDKHRLKKVHTLPKDARVGREDSPWLPCASIMGTTSGTNKPSNVQVTKSTTNSLTITWTPAVAYGTNKLMGTVVRWLDRQSAKSKDEDLIVASYVSLLANENTLTIENLISGTQYRVVVEAVVSVKTSLEPEKVDSKKGENRRTAHVMSDPLYTRTRAPTEPPRLLLISISPESCRLHWEKPLLVTVVGKDDNDQPKYVRRYLEGYKIEINGRDHMTLGPSAQTCTLTKCKPGKSYNVVLVALSCTEDVKKERKQKNKSLYKKSGGQSGEFQLAVQDEMELDHSPSEPLKVTFPKPQQGFLASLEGEFHRSDERASHLSGDIHLKWSTYGETANLLRQFNILWFSDDDHVIQTKYVGANQRSCTIAVTKNKVLYNVSVEPAFYSEIPGSSPQTLHIVIPGPPDAPEIFLKSVETEEFVVEWGEPRLYGGVKVRGYQVYLNDRKAGNELSSTHRKAIIPCRPNRHYKMGLVALSGSPDYADSFMSNSLSISSGPRSPRLGDGSNTLTIEDWSSMADDQDIALKVSSVNDTAIHLDWSTHLDTDGVVSYRVQWSSVAQPNQREVKLDVTESNCVINKCLPGTTHFVRVISVSQNGNIMGKSRQLTVQTSAPPDAPKLTVRACNFRYIAIQWEKPISYGDAVISGYKVYINGVVEATLTPQQFSFTFTHGAWCQEYCFQVQALCCVERLNSKISEPLIIAWPGVKSPILERVPTVSSRAIRVRWENPFCTEGVTVKHFKLLCVDESGKLVQSLGPLHPHMKEAEVRGLQKAAYSIFLETHVHGTSEVVISPAMGTEPAILPDAPELTVSVIGLEERQQLNKVTTELVNKRDRLIRKVGHQIRKIGVANHSKTKDKNQQEIMKAAQTLSSIESLLENCFHHLQQYSGQVMVHLSWQCVQSSRDMEVTGYQVLVDGKHYGNPLVPGVRGVRVQLSLDEPSHTVSVLALTRSQLSSSESNVVEVLTDTFQPFSFYCYHDVHNKVASWPSEGCCRFEDSVKYERQLAKKLANQGLLRKQVPPPACSLLDVFDGEFKPLLTHNKLSHPTVMLFWTPWCLASKQMVSHFVQFARENSKQQNFIAITSNYDARQPRDRQQLIHMITENGLRDDLAVWHCTSHCASMVTSLPNHISRSSLVRPGRDSNEEGDGDKCVDLTELLGIAGVPTLLFIHQDGYIAWHGRYCANSYKEFRGFMKRTFDEVNGRHSVDFNDDTQIDPYIHNILLKLEDSNENLSSLRVGVTEDITVPPMLLPLSEYPRLQRPNSTYPGNRPKSRKSPTRYRKGVRGKRRGQKPRSNTVLFST